ncbi:MAG: tetraacyldisaccharide 4'-kinase [Xanthobacteraceae bacterium]
MREPPFWWREAGLSARLLAPFARLYGAIAADRMRRAGARAAVPVICIGNLTVGGSGKTPTAIAVALLLQRAGLRPVFLSRGYGGALAGPVRVSRAASAAEVGDEPLLLARIAPTIVARDRVAGAAEAAKEPADVIIMDDGLQNPALAKDVALVALDGRRGIGNGYVHPAGPLRAPLAAQLDRAHAVLLVGEAGASAQGVLREAQRRSLPVFTGALRPATSAGWTGRRVLAFAGIADPEKFFATLRDAGVGVAGQIGFPDHHRYSAADATRLIARAEGDGLQLLTTEKDAARMQGDPAAAELAARATPFSVALAIDEEERFRGFLRARTGLAV